MHTYYLNHGFRLMLGCALLAVAPVYAAPDEAMARAQFMIRQISAERDQLQTDRASLQQQLAELQKKYAGLETKNSKSSGDMQQQYAKLRDDLQAERSAHEASRAQLATAVSINNSCSDTVSHQSDMMTLCIGNNHKLYDINRTVLSRYENKNMLDSLIQADPVTGISQVAIENLIDDTQYKLDDLRLKNDSMTDGKEK